MEKQDRNNNLNSDENFLNSLPKIEVNYSKSKNDVWNELSALTESKKPKVKTIRLSWMKYAVAACILFLVGYTGFIYMFTTTIVCPKGEHLSVLLPDNSRVELNAHSNIAYKPYWWNYSRKVKFEGEAFFDITKGSKFEIESKNGKTYILGTSFNIYARGDDYKVTCYTGKVKVVSTSTSDKILLLPKDHAYLTKNGKLEVYKDNRAEEKILWRDHLFLFTNTPLNLVFEEIELQYDINIVEKGKFGQTHTGNFGKEKSVEKVLYNVCMPNGLKFHKGPGKNYIITKIVPK